MRVPRAALAFGVFALTVLGVGCGERSEEFGDTGVPPSIGATTVPVDAVAPSIPPEPTTLPSGAPATTVVGELAFALDSELGRVSGRVPADAGPDPIESSYGAPPDFVVGVDRWVVEDCCRLSVVLQDVPPLHPEEELVSKFESAGLIWNVYDGGPRDGSEISAVATIGKLSISVGGQTLNKDRVDGQSTIDVVTETARSIAATEAVAG